MARACSHMQSIESYTIQHFCFSTTFAQIGFILFLINLRDSSLQMEGEWGN